MNQTRTNGSGRHKKAYDSPARELVGIISRSIGGSRRNAISVGVTIANCCCSANTEAANVVDSTQAT
jgi:hypothetical protein